MKRLRRTSAVIWAAAVPFAILVGIAIGGMPDTGKDVPLEDRKVAEAPAADASPTTTTTVPG